MEKSYNKYKKFNEWQIINNALKDLIKNNDVKLFTPKDYIIGYICMKLEEDIINQSIIKKSRS